VTLSEVCVKRPVFATMMSLALVALGAISYTQLGVALLPDIEQPTVTVFTALPGASPEEIESAVTQPIEEALNTIGGIDEMRSINREGYSLVILQFSLDRDPSAAVQDVRDKIAAVVRRLPDGTDPPTISNLDSDSTPILAIALSGPQSVRELTDFADRRVKDLIATAPGVGQVTIDGGRKRAVNVNLDAERMAAYGVSAADVKQALAAQNVEIPGGRVTRGGREDTLRTMARVRSVAEFADLVIGTAPDTGAPIRVRDVGAVEDGTEEVRGAARLNGKDAITLTVQKQTGANIVETADAIEARLDSLRPILPAGAQMLVLRDSSVFVRKSAEEVRMHLVLGGVLASLAVLLFMGSIASTLIAAVAIPASLVATFTALKALHFTLNNITLLALTLAVGIVIDDAIVVIENIHRHMIERQIDPLRAAIDATKEIALAVTATTLSLVVIFLPVAFMSGQVGRMFSSYGVTVAVAVLISLFISLTLTPMLASRFLRGGHHAGRLSRFADRFTGWLDARYVRLVRWSLDHRLVVVVLAVALVGATVPLAALVGQDFMPEDDQSEFEISVDHPTGTSPAAADATMREIEAQVAKLPGVHDVLMTLGDNRGSGVATRGTIYVGLVPIEQRALPQQAVMGKARALFRRYPDLHATVRSLSTVAIGGGGRGGKLRLALRGPDLPTLEHLLERLLKAMRDDPALVDVQTSSLDHLPELHVELDRRAAADLGIDAQQVAETLRTLVGGEVVSSYREGDKRYDVWLRVRGGDRDGARAIARLPLRTRSGALVPLENFATLKEDTGPTLILRYNGVRQVSVSSNPAPGVALSDTVAHVEAMVRELNLPPGYDVRYLGDAQVMADTAHDFVISLVLSLLFVYMVLAAQFESFLHPVTILMALPLTLPFALVSLLITRETLNVYSVFGLFMLLGIIKKNGILQVDYTNTLRAGGMETRAAILEANRARLRPILMTTLTLIAAMAPMTLAHGAGAASRAALAKVVVVGQALSLLVTLLIVPVAYSYFDDAGRWLTRRRRPPPPEEVEEEPPATRQGFPHL
jgi:HAE1 family hydrophobic/amphiphilic exporter-1